MDIPSTRHLPVNEVLTELRLGLDAAHELLLQAPPGAGKTTLVPLALLSEDWLAGRKILMLEPRRMAARAAATRMAQLLGEPVGQTVGYRVRLDSCVSDQTRIEVMTEGILTRRLQRDPGLEDTALVIFDEFHERNLDSDLCLALTLQGREMFREGPPLKLLVMSATLDGDAIAELLGGAAIVTSTGRQYPVETHYGPALQLRDSIVAPVVSTVHRALAEQTGSLLVFLPGQREIRAVARQLASELGGEPDGGPLIAPLYGGLSLEQQQRAIEPAPTGRRKIVLSTNIAETSLTIEGVEAVVDSGLAREALFDPVTGMTRLATRRISRASAIQRQGRAGRLGPGSCYRVWSEEQHGRLIDRGIPEILQADLAPLALQLFSWGITDPAELAWLDPPPEASFAQAIDILEQCGAVFSNQSGAYQLTPHGVRLAQMPLHPRLAHMLLVGCDIHALETACLLAAVLSERNPMASQGADINLTLAILMGDKRCVPELQPWFRRIWEQARRYARQASEIHKPRKFAMSVESHEVVGILLASAYPDRIARRRNAARGEQFQLSNGRAALLPKADPLSASEWLAVAELGSKVGESEDRIYSAASLEPRNFREILSTHVREEEMVDWDYRNEQFVAERRRLVGRIVLSSEPLEEVSESARSRALLGVVQKRGLELLPWTTDLHQWRARVMLLRRVTGEGPENPWPDLSDQTLMNNLEHWLLPYLGQVRRLQDFQSLDLRAILHAQLPWPLPLDIEQLAPERLAVPSGSNIAIDYLQDPPVLAVKLQEMFGCEETPTVAGGRVALQLQLMSPAQRPLQVTQDLASFWRAGYQEVRREMKGRYPKHPWPEDPIQAPATRHTKRRAGLS